MPLVRRGRHDSDCRLPRSQRGITRENPKFFEEAEGPTFIASKPPVITESTHKRLRCCGQLERAGDGARPSSRISDALNNEKPAGVIARLLPAVLPRRASFFFFFVVVSATALGSKVDFARVSTGAFRTVVESANPEQISALILSLSAPQVLHKRPADDKRTKRPVTRVLPFSR